MLFKAAIESGLVGTSASTISRILRIPVLRAHRYLSKVALRQPFLTEVEAIIQLVDSLGRCEVVKEASHLSILLQNAALRIWVEQKMDTLELNADESVRRDLIKLTPVGLAKV